ncbi:PREDICTED: mucin-12 isoform X2 [Rhagoletis zephyria]|uniref:mucin-12 isoform X2 n=1 Tax=Rhagoletis zephyria TaxID=28612 RepID=UPI000811A3EB|nr:PREDICTED: mucin-12 isoform X2 [Rhagoletis zephyria]
MRPPAMQTAALQQNNEVHINTQRQRQIQQQQQQHYTTQHQQLPLQLRPQQYQQQNHQQQQQQQQLQQPQTTPLTLLNQSHYDTTAAQQARKYHFEQPNFTVDKPLNFVATTIVAPAEKEVGVVIPKPRVSRNSAAYPVSVKLPVNDKSRQEQFVQRQHLQQLQQQQPHQPQPQSTSLDCIQLLDLSTSPPHEPVYPLQGSTTAYLPQRPLADVPPPYRRASAASAAPVPTHRASYASQYSRSSSSEDGSIGGGGSSSNSRTAAGFPNTYSRASSAFDDAAEHFIINFPAADSPSHNQNDCTINLPLSETEPLLTNIETTVADKQRSIRLPKSSASLIFTKKDLLPQRTASVTPYHGGGTNNNCTTQQQQQQAKQQKHNQPQQQQQQLQPLQHSASLRSAKEYVARKPVRHLPASYQQQQELQQHQQQQQQQQQQRRSLQLNYNNNLVTTSTCCSANNNYCNAATGKTASVSGSASGSGSIGAVLHKHNQNLKADNPATTTATTNVIPQQQKQQLQQQSGQSNTTTAAATRKQHAYSWYAPVYSALEEELEQDSRDSSPIHNLANTKKQHLNHYQHHRSTNNSSTAVDNETVALLETRNQVNIQAQLHTQANSQSHSGKDGSVGGNGIGISIGGSGVGTAISRAQQKHSGQARRANGGAPPAPTSLPLASAHNTTLLNEMAASGCGAGGVGLSTSAEQTSVPVNGYESEGGLVNSLSGTLPPRRRIENFLKSLVGRKSSSARTSSNSGNSGNADALSVATLASRSDNIVSHQPMPASPEITITGTPSEQNLALMRDAALAGRQYKQGFAAALEQRKSDYSGEKLNVNGAIQGSSSSLNVVQQKLWNMMRREDSAASLYNEKSHSIVQYRGLRKCETVLALTRQTNSLCSPVFGGSAAAHLGAGAKHGSGGGVARHNSCSAGGGANAGSSGMRRTHTTGSGIYSASGVEQIRPLNRLRNSVTSINAAATCSRCSSLLSLAASSSRYSLNVTSNGSGGAFMQAPPSTQMPTSASQQQLQALAASLDCKPPIHSSQQHQQKRERKISNVSSSQLNSNNNVLASNRNADANAAEQCASGGGSSSGNCSRKSSAGAPSTHSASSITPPSNITTATLTSSITSPHASTPTTPTATATAAAAATTATVAAIVVAPESLVVTPTANSPHAQTTMSSYASTSNSNTSGILVDLPSSPTSAASSASTPCTSSSCSSATTPAPTYALPTTSQTYPFTITSLLAMSKANMAHDVGRCVDGFGEEDDDDAMTVTMSSSAVNGVPGADMSVSVVDGRHYAPYATTPAPAIQPMKRFQPFTCKLCLIDVETQGEATTLQLCGCEFCTEVISNLII